MFGPFVLQLVKLNDGDALSILSLSFVDAGCSLKLEDVNEAHNGSLAHFVHYLEFY